MACLRLPLLALAALFATALAAPRDRLTQTRNKRQGTAPPGSPAISQPPADPSPPPPPGYANAVEESEDYVADYAGNENNDGPKVGSFQANDMDGDKFGREFDEPPAERARHDTDTDADADASSVERPKPKKKSKNHKYLKKTFDFLKKVLDPNALMQNAYVTEMLRRFSQHEDHHEHETQESQSSEEERTPAPVAAKKRRGRPRKKDLIPAGITGMIKKGVMSLTQMELDRRKLRRRYRLIKRIARKAKRPLKTAVKIFLSSRNNQGGGYGADPYGNNNNY